jgi:hypothetical protein
MSDEIPQLEFTTKRSNGEVWRVYLANGFRRPTFLFGYLFILIAAPPLFLFGHEVAKGVAAVGLGFIFLGPVFYAIGMWRVIAGNPVFEAPTNISLFDWGIRSENHLRNISLRWENFDSFSETRNLVLLRDRAKRDTTIFPKRDLTSSQLNMLLTILSSHLKGKPRSQ